MRLICFAAGIAGLVACSAASAQPASPSFETISRCFFVYAPITEVGRDLPHPQLFQFGQPRMGWIAGYIQANQSNARFKAVFEGRMAENKRFGVQLEQKLKQAIAARNQSQFNAVVNEAVSCDRQIGIRTDFLPRL